MAIAIRNGCHPTGEFPRGTFSYKTAITVFFISIFNFFYWATFFSWNCFYKLQLLWNFSCLHRDFPLDTFKKINTYKEEHIRKQNKHTKFELSTLNQRFTTLRGWQSSSIMYFKWFGFFRAFWRNCQKDTSLEFIFIRCVFFYIYSVLHSFPVCTVKVFCGKTLPHTIWSKCSASNI